MPNTNNTNVSVPLLYVSRQQSHKSSANLVMNAEMANGWTLALIDSL